MCFNGTRRAEEPFGDARKEAIAAAWKTFKERFPTEMACMVQLHKLAKGHDIYWCKKCEKSNVQATQSNRSGKCKDCGEVVWFTANTFFDHIRRPSAWLFTIYLMEQRIPFSGPDIHRCTGVAISTAWEISKKLSAIISELPELLSICIKSKSAHFAPVFWKRSVETPAHQHPSTEEQEFQKQANQITHQNNGCPPSQTGPAPAVLNSLSKVERKIFDHIKDKRIHFEELYKKSKVEIRKLNLILVNLELDGLIKRLPGDHYERAKVGPGNQIKQSNQLNSGEISAAEKIAIVSAMDYIWKVHYGCSRKYLQLFLAMHSCLVDESKTIFKGMLRALGGSFEQGDKVLQLYVTPLDVRL